MGDKKIEAAPLLAVFEKWGFPRTLCGLGFRIRKLRRFADFHLEHYPVIYSNGTGLSEGVGAETAPPPLLRALDQSSPHRVAMNVPHLFHLLSSAPEFVVEETGLPDVLRHWIQPKSFLRGLLLLAALAGGKHPSRYSQL